MRKSINGIVCAAAVLWAIATPTLGEAQYPIQKYGINPANRPTFSPYLNLLRTDINPAVNYYGIVRPELAFNKGLQQLQSQQSALAAAQQEDVASLGNILAPTGTAAGYMTHNRYFMNKNAAGGAASSALPAIQPSTISQPKTYRGGKF